MSIGSLNFTNNSVNIRDQLSLIDEEINKEYYLQIQNL